jgi:uncharacterized protein DUF1573
MLKVKFWPWILAATFLAGSALAAGQGSKKSKIAPSARKVMTTKTPGRQPIKAVPKVRPNMRVDANTSVSKDPTKKVLPSGPAPKIGCDKANYDFGTITQGEDVKNTFIIKNTGKGPLKIERARGG